MANILVVDDEVGIRELLSEILSDEGYAVVVAENAASAREVVSKQAFDLILLDIWMPDTDGVTLLKEWGAKHVIKCPVIMMSGHATIETAVEATKFGALNFLEKPISLQKLLSSVQNGLEVGERIKKLAKHYPQEKSTSPAAPSIEVAPEEKLPVFDVSKFGISIDFGKTLKEVRDATEIAYLATIISYEHGQMTRVAQRAGLERTHLYRKLKSLKLEPAKILAGEPVSISSLQVQDETAEDKSKDS